MLARNVCRTLVRRSVLAAASVDGPRRATLAVTRTLSAASVRKPAVVVEDAAPESVDLIRDCIKGIMMKQQDDEARKPIITDDQLKRRLQAFESLVVESQSCISDCDEAPPENLAEEAKAASDAVDRAFAAYIDLLEDLRRADQTQENQYRQIREQTTTRLKLLRQELDAILERS